MRKKKKVKTEVVEKMCGDLNAKRKVKEWLLTWTSFSPTEKKIWRKGKIL
jgi:hypothetical protein